MHQLTLLVAYTYGWRPCDVCGVPLDYARDFDTCIRCKCNSVCYKCKVCEECKLCNR